MSYKVNGDITLITLLLLIFHTTVNYRKKHLVLSAALVYILDPSLPAGRRREIDNVMKKARAQNSPTSSAIWEKKLLEVEAKDSNRYN